MEKKDIIKFWDKFAEEHQTSKVFNFSPVAVPFVVRDTYEKFKEEFLNRNKNKISVLEVGCGTGVFTKLLIEEKKIKKIVAVDISPKNIELCKKNIKHKKLRFAVGDLENLRYKNNSYDLVVGFETLHHLDGVDSAISEAFRVSKETVIFNEPNWYCPIRRLTEMFYYKPEIHETSFKPEELKKLFKKHTDDIKIFKYSFIFPYINSQKFIEFNYRLSKTLNKTFLRHISASLLIVGKVK